jgi:transposase
MLSMFGRPSGCVDQLTEVERAAIVTMWKLDVPRDEIACKMHCHLNTVGHWIRAWESEHSVHDSVRSGRPRITGEDTDVRIEEMAEERKFVTPRDIRGELELDCCARTVRRRLDEVNLFGRIARESDCFEPRVLRLRLAFANGFKHYTEDNWGAVIYSDEVHFGLGHHGQVWVQRPPNTAHHPQYCSPPEQPGVDFTMWGCFCAKGIGSARIFLGDMNGSLYKDICEHNLKHTYERYYPSGFWQLLQDNASPHYTPAVRAWMHNHGVSVLEFPPYSPDLNPIENLWHTIKVRVESLHPHTSAELEQHVQQVYEAVTPAECATLAHSMRSRLQQCIEFEGHKTKY